MSFFPIASIMPVNSASASMIAFYACADSLGMVSMTMTLLNGDE
jgi:hypothetical protein